MSSKMLDETIHKESKNPRAEQRKIHSEQSMAQLWWQNYRKQTESRERKAYWGLEVEKGGIRRREAKSDVTKLHILVTVVILPVPSASLSICVRTPPPARTSSPCSTPAAHTRLRQSHSRNREPRAAIPDSRPRGDIVRPLVEFRCRAAFVPCFQLSLGCGGWRGYEWCSACGDYGGWDG